MRGWSRWTNRGLTLQPDAAFEKHQRHKSCRIVREVVQFSVCQSVPNRRSYRSKGTVTDSQTAKTEQKLNQGPVQQGGYVCAHAYPKKKTIRLDSFFLEEKKTPLALRFFSFQNKTPISQKYDRFFKKMMHIFENRGGGAYVSRILI